MELVELEELLNEVRQTFKSGKTRSFSWRKRQLEGILEFLHDKEQDIFSALKQDLGKHKVEAFRDEVSLSLSLYLFFSLVSSFASSEEFVNLFFFFFLFEGWCFD